jgi:prepilin-type N-terminal cleavage/methylation domain-containing protein
MRALLFFIQRGQPVRESRSDERGTTLVEVLVASAVMAILMVGVLQIFSLALITNQGAAARTDLTYRAQQVMENLRMIQYFAMHTNNGPAKDAGVTYAQNPATLVASVVPTTTTVISNDPADKSYLFWHGAGVVGVDAAHPEKDPFRISYTIENLAGVGGAPPWAANFYVVTVVAAPANAPGGVSGSGYLGEASKMKRVEYVGQLLHN